MGVGAWQASQLSYAVPHEARHARRGPETPIPRGCLHRQNPIQAIQAEPRVDGPESWPVHASRTRPQGCCGWKAKKA